MPKINMTELLADRENGTDGPWYCDDGCDVRDRNDVMAGIVVTDTPEIDARRIARLPDLEAAYIEAVGALRGIAGYPHGGVTVKGECSGDRSVMILLARQTLRKIHEQD